jgi:signal-transduction protein with cAMP-binding, CBS, and nucleotidyltransferase domain
MSPSSSSFTIGEVMTEKIETIKVIETAQEAAMKMNEKNISSLAVVHEDGSPAGIVTERDLVRQICATGKTSSKVKVQEIISSPVKTIRNDTSIGEAADMMVRNRIRHLLVIDNADKKPLGIVSATDIVAYVRENSRVLMKADKDVVKTLEEEGRFYF